MPQIQENYALQSGEGLSIFFVFIWLLGDLANMIGAYWQGLLPTITYLGFYYVACDITLLVQIFYYREKRRRHPHLFKAEEDSETTALLGATHREQQQQQQQQQQQTQSATAEKDDGDTLVQRIVKSEAFVSVTALTFVACVGVFGWFITKPTHGAPPPEIWDEKAQIVGWLSAVLYLTSRIPQIIKNTESKCEGLSLLFFFFALMGNVTFCASIIIPSTDAHHMTINLSWLVGSAGTILLDFIVLGQFAYYAKERKLKAEHGGQVSDSGLAAA